MAITRADLYRLLPAVDSAFAYNEARGLIKSTNNDKQLCITYSEIPDMSVGALNLPQLELEFCFSGWREAGIEEFMMRFERIFQRGGG